MNVENFKEAEVLYARMNCISGYINVLDRCINIGGSILLEDSKGCYSQRMNLPKDTKEKVLKLVKSTLEQELESIKNEFEKL